MAKYLLACSCGEQIVVDQRQAGGHLKCTCGVELAVPPLRKLRHLPLAESPDAQADAGWTAGRGVVAALFIVAGILAAAGGYFVMTSPQVPQYDPDVHMQEINNTLENLTPALAWATWLNYYRHLGGTGFSEYRHPQEVLIVAVREQHRIYYTAAFALAGLCAVIAIAAAVFSAKPRGN